METKDVLVRLSILLLLYDSATCLIIPEELPTILSLIYSNIPPIKKGTDSRVGVGFRLGEHADFQVLLELGPQTETDPIGTADTKRRRDAMLSAAMKGELGPLAQAVAKYQMERKLQRELDKLKTMQEKLREKKKAVPEGSNDEKSVAGEWLATWSKGMGAEGEVQKEKLPDEQHLSLTDSRKIQQRIGKPPGTTQENISSLTKLYEAQSAPQK